MASACIHIDKIKSMGTLKSRWNHDIDQEFRREHVANANAEEYEENDILVPCMNSKGEKTSYDKAVKDRIKDLKQSDGRKIRKGQVLAYDIVLEFGDMDDIISEGIDTDEWEKRSVEWLKETFNVAGDGKSNLISVVCHKDESSPHIHAIVTPVDERGCLCARSFTDGFSALSQFQTAYAKKLEDLGIERGVKGSSAHHKSNRKYNAEKEEAAKIPEPKPNELAADYLARYQLELENRAIDHKVKMDKLERQLRSRMDKERLLTREELEIEIDAFKDYYEYEKSQYKEAISELEPQKLGLIHDVEKLKNEKEELIKEIYNIEKMKTSASLWDEEQSMIQIANKEHPELVEQYIGLQDKMESIYQSYLDSMETELNEHDELDEI